MKTFLSFFLWFFLPIISLANSLGEHNNAFGITLFSQLEDKDKNMVFSPYGIFSNLTLLYYGAAETTAQELQNALHLSSTGDVFLTAFQKLWKNLSKKTEFGYEFFIKNAIFPHQGTYFLTNFEDLATESFGANLQSIDYEIPDRALKIINQWIEETTEGKIQTLVTDQDINALTRLIVANSVYFKGNWLSAFQTQQGCFLSPQGKKEVQMLHQTHTFPYYETEEMQCLALPFIRHGTLQPFIECLLVLPKQTSLYEIEKNLDPQTFVYVMDHLQPIATYVQIPKFCFSKTLVLNNTLKKLGVKEAFDFQADFSKIDGIKDLCINQVLHKTYFSFHEYGVEASSATTSHMGMKSLSPELEYIKDFIADHPFLFFIVDVHSKAILFMGRITDPSAIEDCDGD